MALFQPTYVLPDARQGLGEGTVDVSEGLTVSWHINGSSALVKFKITIFRNDSGSTQLYTTEERTEGCPAYGTAADGGMLFFSYTIPASALRGAGITNGGEYKLEIRQWWSASDSVTQSSASAFTAKDAPMLSIGEIGTISTRNYTFAASYSQAQGDVLNWFRWRIAVSGKEDTPLYDSGNISGTMDLRCTYDGFFSGTAYTVRLTAQTESGIEADTGWVPFAADYDMPWSSGNVIASQALRTDAVRVEWPGVTYIPGMADGTYSLSGGSLLLSAGSLVSWMRVNDMPMNFSPVWGLIWRARIREDNTALLTIGQDSGDLVLGIQDGTVTLKKGGAVLAAQSGVRTVGTLTAVLTETALYLRSGYLSGGLYPAADLYPSGTLYPRDDTESGASIWRLAVNYTQDSVTGLTLRGDQECELIELTEGTTPQETISAVWERGEDVPAGQTDYMRADFTDSLNAGNLDTGGDTIEGYAIYRRHQDDAILEHVADVERNVTALYDYGACSGQGSYAYYLFPIGTRTYISQSLVSNAVFPVFWNWTVLECAETADGFQVVAEYRFRNNVSSGTMSNNNTPGILENFTRYPTVQRSPLSYKSGTLSALIGYVRLSDGMPVYTDTLKLRDAIFALPLSDHVLFLKNRKGDLLRIRISEAVTMQTADNTREQAQTVSLSWAETGSAENIGIYAFESMAVNSPDSGAASKNVIGRGQVKTVTPAAGAQIILPDTGYDYLERVIVEGVPFTDVPNGAGTKAKIGS